MNVLALFVLILSVFWLVIAGFSLQSAAVGLMTILFVVWWNRDLLRTLIRGKVSLPGKKMLILAGYFFSLLWQIVLANIQVARILLSRKMPLQPVVVTFNPGLSSDLSKTVLANSITLTPGTLTLAVEGDEFTVHTLTLSAAQDVVDWPLINLLRLLEGERE